MSPSLKAGVIAGCVCVVAEAEEAPLRKRHAQGWVDEVVEGGDLDALVRRVKEARAAKQAVAIAYHGNVVDVWERFAAEEENLIEVGSDQTSLHNPCVSSCVRA